MAIRCSHSGPTGLASAAVVPSLCRRGGATRRACIISTHSAVQGIRGSSIRLRGSRRRVVLGAESDAGTHDRAAGGDEKGGSLIGADRILSAASAADSALGPSASQCGGTTIDRLIWGAARLGDAEAIEYLLAKGGGIGWVPLAVYNRDGQLSSADQAMGMTSLCVAAMEGHLDVVRLLLRVGANANLARSADGATPLFLAAMYKHEAVVKALIEGGADVNLAFPSSPPEQNGQGTW